MELGQQHRPRNLLPVPTPRKLQPRLTAFSSVKKPREQSSEVERDPCFNRGCEYGNLRGRFFRVTAREAQSSKWTRGDSRTEQKPCLQRASVLHCWPRGSLGNFFHVSIPRESQRRKEGGCKIQVSEGFPGGSVVKNLPANAGDVGSIPGPGGSHGPQSNSARGPQLLTCAREPRSRNYGAHLPSSWSPNALEPGLCDKRSHGNEKPSNARGSPPHCS